MSGKRKRSVADYEDEAAFRKAAMLLPCAANDRNNGAGESSTNNHKEEDSYLVDDGLPSKYPPITEAHSMTEEVARLITLKSYMILDSEKELMFDRLTKLASRLFRVPIAAVSLVDLERQWFKSSFGLEATETTRQVAFCAHTITCTNEVLIVPDATKDPRFRDNPLVTGPLHIRFYAGAALVSPEGSRLGSFCVIDTVARPLGLSEEEVEDLKGLAGTAMQLMVDRKERKERECPSSLIALTAHDLITPLTTMQLSLSLIKDGTQSQQQNELIDTALLSANLMTGICKTTLATMRQCESGYSSERGDESPRKNILKMKELVQNLRAIVEPVPKQVPFVISLDPNAPEAVIADELTVFRSCLNLLMNSIERTNQGSIRLLIRQDSESQTIIFECHDNGPDRSSQDIPNTFLGGQESKELSLEAVASHMKRLNGKFGYDSNSVPVNTLPSSRFWFELPLRLPDDMITKKARLKTESPLFGASSVNSDLPGCRDSSAAAIEPTPTRPETSGKPASVPVDESPACSEGTKRALIVEDSTVIRKCLGRALTKQGFHVSYACDGLEGLQQLKSKVFHLTLMDFLMPNLDGVDCVKKYREWELQRRPSIRQHIVGISAHADAKAQNKGLEAGMDDFRPKPITIDMLKELVEDERVKKFATLVERRQSETDSLCLDRNIKERATNYGLVVSNLPASEPHLALEVLQSKGWSITVVNDNSSCLDSLQKKSWNLVLIDDDLHRGDSLSAMSCVTSFRKWEQDNRVIKQRNVFLVCSSPIPSPMDVNSAVQPPHGFNGVLSKPVEWDDLNFLLQKNQQQTAGDLGITFNE